MNIFYKRIKIYNKCILYPSGHIVIIVFKLDSLANTKIRWINIEMKIIEASFDESSVYSLFVYVVRSQITREITIIDYWEFSLPY
jgi:hypothetical protein